MSGIFCFPANVFITWKDCTVTLCNATNKILYQNAIRINVENAECINETVIICFS